MEVAKELKTKAEGRLDGYEAMLSKTRFLAGDVSARMTGVIRDAHLWPTANRTLR